MGEEINITFTIEEINDVLENLDQCLCEGYLTSEDPSFSAMEKLNNAYFEWKRKFRERMSENEEKKDE